MSKVQPVVLVILDGFGINPRKEFNAIANATKPNLDALLRDYPNSRLSMSGIDVGLPAGQMGNSEVGHMILGAGRIVYQDLTLIHKDIDEGASTKTGFARCVEENQGEAGGSIDGVLGDGGFIVISGIWRRSRMAARAVDRYISCFSTAATRRPTAPSSLCST
jgi:2,3-bisphosphoglycerate-independent phosphoglycerate mutase